ncbi:MAG: hypothetical protein GX845_02390 [Erysipelothrix sp.]|nr:hypothetical protein [Erysipelothrix sp.]
MKIFNSSALSQNERFLKALTIGILLSIGLIVFSAAIQMFLSIRTSIIYLISSLVLTYVLKKVGRGVQIRFAILGAVLMFIIILLSDIFTLFGFQVIVHPGLFLYAMKTVIATWLMVDIGSLISLLLKVYAIHYAYINSRII